jgi:Domain of unknown function (DUF4457)
VGAAVAGIKNVLRSRRNSRESIPEREKEMEKEKEKEKEKVSRTKNITPPNKSDVLESTHRRHSSDVRNVRAEESSSSSLNSTFPKSSSSVLQKLAAKKKSEEGTKETKKEKEKEKDGEKGKEKGRNEGDKVLSKGQNNEFDNSKQTKKIEKSSKDRKRDKKGTGPRDDVNDGMEGSSSGMHGTEIDGRIPGLTSRITATVNPANVNRKSSLSPTYTDLEDSLNGFAPPQNSDPQKNLGKIKTPFFPRGKILKMEIYSTWGDGLYVGLNGLDIFDENGDLLSNNSSGKSSVLRIESDRKNLLSLPEFENDPREVSNIVNGTNFTRNDLHVWLAPLGNLENNNNENIGNSNNSNNSNVNEKKLITSISIFFKKSITISLIRVFNYNKSRTHCTRGVRDCVFKLDDVTIFEG